MLNSKEEETLQDLCQEVLVPVIHGLIEHDETLPTDTKDRCARVCGTKLAVGGYEVSLWAEDKGEPVGVNIDMTVPQAQELVLAIQRAIDAAHT